MKMRTVGSRWVLALFAAALLLMHAGGARAAIEGITGTTFNFTAKVDHLSTGEGGSVQVWAFADSDGAGRAQYPGPTLIVNEGDLVTVNLSNDLPEPVSLVFPGHDVTARPVTDPTAMGLITREALPGGTVRYTFIADTPGTYTYHSGTRPEVQVEMGLVGALIVRPAGFNPASPTAYGSADTAYEREYLLLISEMDSRIHNAVEMGGVAALEQTNLLGDYFPNYWFVNGRNAPDSLFPSNIPWMPTQPYSSIVLMHPGDRVLMRIVAAGRDLHPFHPHGSHHRVIAHDGNLLESAAGMGADLSYEQFTLQAVPGATYDAIYEWTGKNLGWDVYGSTVDDMDPHDCVDVVDNRTGAATPDGFDDPGPGGGLYGVDYDWEWCADHEKPFPVVMPEPQELTFGGFWSGSPYLGAGEPLPPGEGGLNPNGGFSFLWHSHTEKELINFDVFPGGLLTILIVESPAVELP